ncbi:hypothetical protein NOVO_07195 [Rickettsiales bacterium Ac37b]|nr:hypothetical protein NOVO_07195 [Rickettsiales bacterium Ac37b]
MNIRIYIIYILIFSGCYLIDKNVAFAQNNKSHLIQETFKQLPVTDFGVKADLPEVKYLSSLIPEPKISKTGKSLLTVNKTGFDVLNNSESQDNWIIRDFLSFCTKLKKPILDIGAGYGYISKKALSLNLKVIANDSAVEHLLYLRKSIDDKPEYLHNLYLNYAEFPFYTDFPTRSLSAVVLYRVLHFLSPIQIETGLEKIVKWLEPGGKIFIVVMSPTHIQFRDWFLPVYEKNWISGKTWPGEYLEVAKALPDQEYNLPQYLHVMDERPLKRILEKLGFHIEKSDYISMKHLGNKNSVRDGQEAIGIIAVLNK